MSAELQRGKDTGRTGADDDDIKGLSRHNASSIVIP
jgi:hypothetical protein